MSRRGALQLLGSVALLPVLGAVEGRDELRYAAGMAHWSGAALGGSAEIRFSADNEARALDLLERAIRETNRLERIFSLYRVDSTLMRLNQQGSLLIPPPELLELLSIVDLVHRLTDGVFDPTIQPLWRLYAETGGKPDPEALMAARNLVGWHRVRYDTQEVHLGPPGARLSLNGIAQGFITDRVTNLLLDEGVDSALVNLGEIRVIGHAPDGEPWSVGLADTADGAAECRVQLVDSAIATSASAATTFDGTASHILDPRNGMPATFRWRRVSVMHPSAAICDGIATAGVLLEETALAAITRQLPGTTVLALPRDGQLRSYPAKAHSQCR